MGSIYDTSAWKRLREAKLTQSPLCEACLLREVVEPAVAVDHIVAINKGGEPFPPLDGLMSLCASCHNSKTRRVDSSDSKPGASRFKGCAVDGSPLDPLDDWFASEPPPAGSAVAAIGLPASRAPGASTGRQIPGWRPSGSTETELVSCEPFATSEREWV